MKIPQYQEIASGIVNPRRLFIFSNTKVGKTSLLSTLPNNLIIDTEDGSTFVPGIKFNLLEEHAKTGIGKFTLLKELTDEIKKQNKFFDYISIDTATGLEDAARGVATYLYKKSNSGKNFSGMDVVTELPQGAGYEWLRIAFSMLYGLFDGCFTKSLIITGHIKLTSVNKQGKEIQAKDIQLTGKLKTMVCQKADAIGYLFREKDSKKNIISFRSNENDIVSGARPPHLRNQEIIISEFKDDKFITHWDKIFLS